MRAKSLAARRSGRSERSDGRRMPPASTSSVTLFSCSKARPVAAAPTRHHACGTPRTISRSASPSMASTKTSRPAARQLSIKRRGKPPLPATMPSLFAIRLLRLADSAARIGTDELEDIFDRSDAAKAIGDFVHTVAERAVRVEQKLIGFAQAENVFTAETAPLHADDIEPAKTRPLPHYLAVGDDIALNPGHPADHGVPADPNMLMDRAKPPEKSVIIDDHMAAKCGVVGHHHMACDLAVMGDMHTEHEQAIVAYPCHHPAAGGSGVHRHIFADRVVAPDDEDGFLTPILQILRLQPDRGKREDACSLADRGAAVDDDVRSQRDPRTERDMLANDAIWPHGHPFGQHGSRCDDGRRMDLTHLAYVYSLRIIAAKTASAIRLSPTFARPSNFQTLPRFRCFAT